MCVPDMALIVEIMLMSEGFNMSKMLSRKFVILYKLCEDLLSKSKHYDWKLRAIKTTLYVAGGMKRAAPELSEDKVHCRCSCLPAAALTSTRVHLHSRQQLVLHRLPTVAALPTHWLCLYQSPLRCFVVSLTALTQVCSATDKVQVWTWFGVFAGLAQSSERLQLG